MEWKQIEQNWVLTPTKPKAVIHFLGGAFFATAPQITYARFLEALAAQQFVIVATPYVNTFDHKQIAIEVHRSFRKVRSKLFLDYFPVFGLGHSMGCKIHLLINSFFRSDRAGNIFLAYNNYGAEQSIPFFKELASTIPEMQTMEFQPSPRATRQIVEQNYLTQHNLLVAFTNDSIDEIPQLAQQLRQKFPDHTIELTLPGTHLTSLGIDLKWQPGKAFTPVDAIAQWVQQGIHRNNDTLQIEISQWLNRRLRQMMKP